MRICSAILLLSALCGLPFSNVKTSASIALFRCNLVNTHKHTSEANCS